jgi:biopolymer transport protein ExbB
MPAVEVPVSTLPQDLTPWGMFLSADVIVKAVMIGLLIASLATWTVWLAKTLELRAARRGVIGALDALGRIQNLKEAADRMASQGGVTAALVESAMLEIRLSRDVGDRDGIKERIASRLERLEAAAGRQINRGTGVLATIGSIAPFVGLFGTVWGIMNSFIGISVSQTTNLAVVAPGIAEALLATALGLVAAIPAVVIYNAFSRSMAAYRGLLGDASAEILRLAGRDLAGRAPLMTAEAAQ